MKARCEIIFQDVSVQHDGCIDTYRLISVSMSIPGDAIGINQSVLCGAVIDSTDIDISIHMIKYRYTFYNMDISVQKMP